MTSPDAIHARIPDATTAAVGVVSSLTPLAVDVGGASIMAASMMPQWRHMVGDRVLTLQARGRCWIIGSTAPRPLTGVATAVTGTTATVTAAGHTLTGVPWVGAAPQPGQGVALGWGDSGVIILGPLSAPAPAAPPQLPAPDLTLPRHAGPVGGSVSGVASHAGTWAGAARQPSAPQIWQGQASAQAPRQVGYLWWSGSLTAPSAVAAPGQARITLTRHADYGGRDARLLRIIACPQPEPPATGLPSRTGSVYDLGTCLPGETRSWPLPDQLAQQLLDGAIYGLALVGADYLAVYGPGADGLRQPRIIIPYTPRSR